VLGKLTVRWCALVPAVASLFLGGGNRQIAADEAYVAGAYGNCAAFTPSPHHCSFAVAATPDRAGGRWYAVELRYQSGDDCYAGIVYFFEQRGSSPGPGIFPRTASAASPRSTPAAPPGSPSYTWSTRIRTPHAPRQAMPGPAPTPTGGRAATWSGNPGSCRALLRSSWAPR
jgi:hypothetical protein